MKDPKKGKKTKRRAVLQKRTPTDPGKREHMMAVMLRNESVFHIAKEMLTLDELRTFSVPFAVLWKMTLRLNKKYGGLPDVEMLSAEIQQHVNRFPELLADSEVVELDEFLHRVYDEDSEDYYGTDIVGKKHAEYALSTLRSVKEEILAEVARTALADDDMEDVAEVLRQYLQEATNIRAIEGRPSGKIFDVGWDLEQSRPLYPTGLPIFDVLLCGGHAVPEINLFMAPYGSCKTTAAVQAYCESIRSAAARTLAEEGDVVWKVAFVSYECGLKEFRQRCLAYMAMVPRDVLADMKSIDDLSTDADEDGEYESAMYSEGLKDADRVPSRRERVEMAAKLVNAHGLFYDMSGVDEAGGALGCNGVSDIQACISADTREFKGELKLAVVWIDHLAGMVAQMQTAGKLDDKTSRSFLKRAPKAIVDIIGKPFQCPIWLLHQLSGEANSRGPTAKMDHTDSDECKSVGMFADNAIVAGKQTQDANQFIVFRVSKHRRSPPRCNMVVKVDGRYNRIVNVSNKYGCDANSIKPWAEIVSLGGEVPDDVLKATGKTKEDLIEEHKNYTKEAAAGGKAGKKPKDSPKFKNLHGVEG